MKKAEGFITEDGTFFEQEEEAALYEAELALRRAIPNGMDPDRVLTLIQHIMSQLRRYIDAYQVASKRADAESGEQDGGEGKEEAKAGDGLGHVASTEEDLTSLLQLPARGPEHVSNMGSSPRAAKIPDGRSKHGPRGR